MVKSRKPESDDCYTRLLHLGAHDILERACLQRLGVEGERGIGVWACRRIGSWRDGRVRESLPGSHVPSPSTSRAITPTRRYAQTPILPHAQTLAPPLPLPFSTDANTTPGVARIGAAFLRTDCAQSEGPRREAYVFGGQSTGSAPFERLWWFENRPVL